MQRHLPILLALLLTGFNSHATSLLTDPPVTRTLRVAVTNISEATGMIWVGIYTGEDNFLIKEKARLVGVKITQTGTAYIDLPKMQVGKEYALAFFHDVDNDGDMNTNWLGLPTEPWAFSGEPKTRLRLPRFDEVSFQVRATEEATTVRLRMF